MADATGSADNHWMGENQSAGNTAQRGPAEPPARWGTAAQRQLQWSLQVKEGWDTPQGLSGKGGLWFTGKRPLNTITEHPAHWGLQGYPKENPSKKSQRSW